MKLLNLMYLLNFVVFCFLVFSRFLLLLVKTPKKNLEKTKKNCKKTSRKPKKNKIARKHRENQKNKKKQNCKTHVGTSWWVRVCNFGFFGFLEVFFGFWPKVAKTSRKPKKPKKQNCKTHVGTSWWVRVCNFGFFGFLEVFLVFDQK